MNTNLSTVRSHPRPRLPGYAAVTALALTFGFASAIPATYGAGGGGVQAVRVASGFFNPLYICAPPGDTTRVFVAEQQGKIKIVNLPSGTVNETPFLDISDRV
ncbi:MAG TPA: hypothetical protein VFJ88_08145, partial [Chthoniobacterales bacterium]|nr:hypothetical protein [Chthoniobacterales bacterium]